MKNCLNFIICSKAERNIHHMKDHIQLLYIIIINKKKIITFYTETLVY